HFLSKDHQLSANTGAPLSVIAQVILREFTNTNNLTMDVDMSRIVSAMVPVMALVLAIYSSGLLYSHSNGRSYVTSEPPFPIGVEAIHSNVERAQSNIQELRTTMIDYQREPQEARLLNPEIVYKLLDSMDEELAATFLWVNTFVLEWYSISTQIDVAYPHHIEQIYFPWWRRMLTSETNIVMSEQEHVCAFVTLLEDGLIRMNSHLNGLEASLLRTKATKKKAVSTLHTSWEIPATQFLWRQSIPVIKKASATSLSKILLVKSRFELGFEFQYEKHITRVRTYKNAFHNSYGRLEDLRAGWGCRNTPHKNALGTQNRSGIPIKGSAPIALKRALSSVQYMYQTGEERKASV
ncbi:hypothetical protein BS50DRAFT_666554, partial [Corynespora cassiicola Philippines]